MNTIKMFVLAVLFIFAFASVYSCGVGTKENKAEKKDNTEQKVDQAQTEKQTQIEQKTDQGNSGAGTTKESTSNSSVVTGVYSNNLFGYNWCIHYDNIKPEGSVWSGDYDVIWKDKAKNEVYYIVNEAKERKANPGGTEHQIGYTDNFYWPSVPNAEVKDGYFYTVGEPTIRCQNLNILEFCVRTMSYRGKQSQELFSPPMWVNKPTNYTITSEKYPNCGDKWTEEAGNSNSVKKTKNQ